MIFLILLFAECPKSATGATPETAEPVCWSAHVRRSLGEGESGIAVRWSDMLEINSSNHLY